jgi:hypothetical protein
MTDLSDLMSPLQKYLQRAAAELDLRIEIAHAVTLSDRRILISQVLFPDLGNHSGTLVFTVEDRPDQSARGELLKRQYATSIMSGVIPKNSVFDIESLKETFSDWGWIGDPSRTPSWMRETPQTLYH